MSEIRKILDNYKTIRAWFRSPPNAVPDLGIDLKRPKITTVLPSVASNVIPLPAPLAPPMPDPPVETKWLTVSSTVKITAAEFGLTSNDLMVRSRKQSIAFPRQVAIYIAAKQQRWSVSQIGKYFRLDHTTALHAIRKIKGEIERDLVLKERISLIETKLALLPKFAPPPDDQSHLENGEIREDLPEPTLSSVD